MFDKRTTQDIDLKAKKVLLRVDYNVPMKNGAITDNNRIKVTKKTIENLLEKDVEKIIIVSHMGRPKGIDPELSLEKIAQELEKIIQKPVQFISDWQNYNFQESTQIVLLENLRFDSREKKNDIEFAKELVKKTGADIFIQDGFAVCHRTSTTTNSITKILPSVASIRLKNEYQKVNYFINNPQKPVLAIIGGAKISDKIDFIKRIIPKVSYLVIGGAMANTFLLAEGKNIGKSLVEEDQTKTANQIKKLWLDCGKNIENLVLPFDVKTTTNLESKNVVIKTTKNIEKNEMIGDIGPKTTKKICDLIDKSESVFWNGNIGYTENVVLAESTKTVINKLNNIQKLVLVGGGDTIGFVNQTINQIYNQKMFLSTGGGAMLELISYKKLAGVESLLDN